MQKEGLRFVILGKNSLKCQFIVLNQLSLVFRLKITIYITLANILGNSDFEMGVRDRNMQFTFLEIVRAEPIIP